MKYFINKKIANVFLLVLCFALTPFSLKADNKDVQAILVQAKMTGWCGAVNMMIVFQGTTNMQGGTEFLSRYLNTEASRLGFKNKEELMKNMFGMCDMG